jgi:P pilus assembly chaperone PapD
MNGTRVFGAAALVAAALIPSTTTGAAAGGPAAALGVSPLRLELKGASSAAITVRNPGARPLVVTVARAGFARTLRGKPRIEAVRGAAGWLHATPRRLRLAPHKTGTFRLAAKPPSTARPGDHPALVLLETRPRADKKVHVLLRVGVVVLVRISGSIVHRLEPQALSVRRDGTKRVFSLRLANRGNVAERIAGARVEIVLNRHGRSFAALRTRRFDVLPHSAGIAEFPYGGAVRGPVVARVVLRPPTIGRSRSFRVTVP